MNGRGMITNGWIGRTLRIVIGIFLVASVALVYLRRDWQLTLISVGIAVMLTLFYGLVHFVLVKYMTHMPPLLGAILAIAPLILVYILGSGSAPIFGHGRGQLGTALFLGVSLLLAGFVGDRGCEVMAIPNLLFRKPTYLACLFFSPIDWLEQKFQKK